MMRVRLTKEQIKAIADRAEGIAPAGSATPARSAPLSQYGAPPALEDKLRNFIGMLRAARPELKADPRVALSAQKVVALGEQFLQKYGKKK